MEWGLVRRARLASRKHAPRRAVVSGLAVLVLSTAMTGVSAARAAVTPGVVVTPSAGYVHPGGTVTVALSGFAPNEAVDVYWDTTDTLLLVSGGTGAASASFATPAAASPGTHYVTAVGRRSQRAGQAAYEVFTDWSQFGFGAKHQGSNPYENVLNTANVGRLAMQWTNPLDGTAVSGSPIVVAGDVYVATTGGHVFKVDGDTGATIWTRNIGSDIEDTPAIGNGGAVLVVGDDAGDIVGLKTADGTRAWPRLHTGGAVEGSPTTVGGVAYVPSSTGTIFAVDISTGAVQWSVTTPGSIYQSPVVADGALYVEFCGSTGAQLETVQLDDLADASYNSLIDNCENVATTIAYIWSRVVGLVGNGGPGADFCDFEDLTNPNGAHAVLAALENDSSCAAGTVDGGAATFSDGNVAVTGAASTLDIVDLNYGLIAANDVGSGGSTPTVADGFAVASGAAFDQTGRALNELTQTCDGAAYPVANGHVYCASQYVAPPFEVAGLVSYTVDGDASAAVKPPVVAHLRPSRSGPPGRG